MKKSLYFGFVAIVVAMSVVFVACKDDEEKPVETTYTVTFNTGTGGSTVAPATVKAGATVSEPADPEKAGHDFGGWFKEETFTTEWNFTDDTVTANTTLYAKWTEAFTDVSTYYEIVSDKTPTGVTATAKQSNKDGTIYISLGGTVPDGSTPATEDWGSDAGAVGTLGGKFAGIFLSGTKLFEGNATKALAIKQTNQSLRYYTNLDILTEEPTKPVEEHIYTIYIPPTTTGLPYKWRIYNIGALLADGGYFSFLVWNNASPKTATFEIQSYASFSSNAEPTNDVALKVIVDWTGLTFN
ncbi:MAG: InlB B-repeat-containing protein [Treponema sp.]|nr:InlB B-repeat-containing protein [Treponema sp.]